MYKVNVERCNWIPLDMDELLILLFFLVHLMSWTCFPSIWTFNTFEDYEESMDDGDCNYD